MWVCWWPVLYTSTECNFVWVCWWPMLYTSTIPVKMRVQFVRGLVSSVLTHDLEVVSGITHRPKGGVLRLFRWSLFEVPLTSVAFSHSPTSLTLSSAPDLGSHRWRVCCPFGGYCTWPASSVSTSQAFVHFSRDARGDGPLRLAVTCGP